MAPRGVPVSGGSPLASLHFTMHALQPMHRVASYSSPTASGGGTFLSMANAFGIPAADAAAAEAIPFSTARRVGDMSLPLPFLLPSPLRLAELFRGHHAGAEERPDRQACDPDGGGADSTALRLDGRIAVRGGRLLDFHGREQGDAKRHRPLRAADAGLSDPDGPDAGYVGEMTQ